MKSVMIIIVMLMTILSTSDAPASLTALETTGVIISVEVKPAKEVIPVPVSRPSNGRATTIREYIDKLCTKNCIDADRFIDETKTAAKKYGLPEALLAAVVKVESDFNVMAKNTVGGLSGGLMQVQVRWHQDKIAGRDIYDASVSLDVGAQILKTCMVKHNNNTRAALMCYNGYSNEKYPDKVFAAQKQINQLAWTKVRPTDKNTRTIFVMES